MGGPGSGNFQHWWRPPKKGVVEDSLTLDANEWAREGILKAGVRHGGAWRWTYRSGSGFSVRYEVLTRELGSPLLRLSYSWTWGGKGQTESADYHVRLAATRPHYGGLRWWFTCPLAVGGRACNRRVGKLYLPPGARFFGCRTCYGLTYTSCQESHKWDSVFRRLARETGEDFAVVKEALEGLRDRRG